jgi:hypothetical protein
MNDNNGIAIRQAALGPLAFLSLQHPARHVTPDAPSNEERIRAYRNMLPVMLGNTYTWAFRHAVLHSTGG